MTGWRFLARLAQQLAFSPFERCGEVRLLSRSSRRTNARLSRACLASATGHHLRPVGAARKAGIPAGQVRGWGLAAMPRDRWGGIVAVTAGWGLAAMPRDR